MTTYKVKPNQSMPDVIIQSLGTLEAGMRFCADNGVGISDIPLPDTVYTVSDAAIALAATANSSAVLRYYAQNGIVAANLHMSRGGTLLTDDGEPLLTDDGDGLVVD